MQKFLVLALACMIISCSREGKGAVSNTTASNDSILFYYNTSNTATTQKSRLEAINKALSISKNLKTDTLYSKILYRKNLLSLSNAEYDSLKAFHRLLLNHVERIGDKSILGREFYLMGYYYDQIEKNSDSAFWNYNLSKTHFVGSRDSSWAGKSLYNMGVIQKDQNDFFGSKETVTEALRYLDHEKDSIYRTLCLNVLATDHRKLLNDDEAIEIYRSLIDDAKTSKEQLAYKNNLAATYIDNGQYQKAIAILQPIISGSLLKENTPQYARVLDNLSYVKWLSDKENYENPFQEALEIRKVNEDSRGQIASYTHLGEFYMGKQPEMAISYFDTVIQVSKRIKAPKAEMDALKFMMQLQPKNVRLHERYIFLDDSLDAEELNVKTQFAKYKYDDQLKQESILRLEKEKAEQALLASEERSKKSISYLGSLLLVLGLSFAIYFFRQRTKRLKEENKTAKLVATLETEAEMSRRLHDDFGAGLNQTMLMLQGDIDKTKVLDKLDGLYNQSRNFSREVNEVDTGTPFKEEFLEMLRYRTPSQANLIITGTKDIEWNGVPPLSKKVLYKVMQELMINMGKHSEASLVTIVFKKSGSELLVKYNDNGVGASQKDINRKNGLRNTEKRIQAIGGSITFDSGKDEGFSAHVVIPI